MGLLRVYSEPQLIKHYSTVCSKALLFQLLVYAIIIVVPFFFCHGTNGIVLFKAHHHNQLKVNSCYFLSEFWQYSSTYTEQPDVNFMNQWIVQVANSSGPSAASWSTIAGLNRLLQPDEIAIPVVMVRSRRPHAPPLIRRERKQAVTSTSRKK